MAEQKNPGREGATMCDAGNAVGRRRAVVVLTEEESAELSGLSEATGIAETAMLRRGGLAWGRAMAARVSAADDTAGLVAAAAVETEAGGYDALWSAAARMAAGGRTEEEIVSALRCTIEHAVRAERRGREPALRELRRLADTACGRTTAAEMEKQNRRLRADILADAEAEAEGRPPEWADADSRWYAEERNSA